MSTMSQPGTALPICGIAGLFQKQIEIIQSQLEALRGALNDIGYQGPLSVEWEDAAMDRAHGAAEAAQFCRDIDFEKSDRVFDEAFGN